MVFIMLQALGEEIIVPRAVIDEVQAGDAIEGALEGIENHDWLTAIEDGSIAEGIAAAGVNGLGLSNLKNCRQVALAYPELDPRRMAVGLLPDGSDPQRQTSGEFVDPREIGQTSGELDGSPSHPIVNGPGGGVRISVASTSGQIIALECSFSATTRCD